MPLASQLALDDVGAGEGHQPAIEAKGEMGGRDLVRPLQQDKERKCRDGISKCLEMTPPFVF